jgi:hypothetical protein
MARVRSREKAGARAAPGWAHSFLEVEQLLGGVVAPAPVGTAGGSSAPPLPEELPGATGERLQPRSELRETPRRPLLRWAGLMLILLGGLGALLPWRLAQQGEPLLSPNLSAPAPVSASLIQEKAGVVTTEAPSSASVEPPSTPAAPREQGNLSKRPARAHPSPASGGAATRQLLSHGSGVLAVGGAGALRAEIIIDGERRGHAPMLVELPLGEHVLELETPEGRHVGPERVQLTEFHTPASPLRWVVPEDRASRQGSTAE